MRQKSNTLRTSRNTAWAVALGAVIVSGCATPALVVPFHAAEAALIAQMPPAELSHRYSVKRLADSPSQFVPPAASIAMASASAVTPLPPTTEEAPAAAAPSILNLPKDSIWSEFIEVEQKLAVAAAPAKPPENLRTLPRSPHAIRLHTTTIVTALRMAAKAEVSAPAQPINAPKAGFSPAPAPNPNPVPNPVPSIAEAPYRKLLPAVVLDPLEHEALAGEFANAAPPPSREFVQAADPPAMQAKPIAKVPHPAIPEVGDFTPDSAPLAQSPAVAPGERTPIPTREPQRLSQPLQIPQLGEFAPDSAPRANTDAPAPTTIAPTNSSKSQPSPLRLPSTRDLWGANPPSSALELPTETGTGSEVLRPLEKQGVPLKPLLVAEQTTPAALPSQASRKPVDQPTPATPKLTQQPTPATPKLDQQPTPAAPKLVQQPTPASPITPDTLPSVTPPELFQPVEPKHFFAMTSRRRGADPLSFGNPRPSDLTPEPQDSLSEAPAEDNPPVSEAPASPPRSLPKQPSQPPPPAPEPVASPRTLAGTPPEDPRLIPQGVTQVLPQRGLSQISLDIRPPTLTDDQGQAFPAPRNAAAAVFAQAAPFERHEETQFMEPTHLAPGGLEFCYQPLYFEEVNAERYGHDYGPLQPAVSMGQFISRTQWLPYMVFANPARHCTYHAHWTLPGYRIPYKEHPGFPYSAGGAAAEVAYVAGMIMIIP